MSVPLVLRSSDSTLLGADTLLQVNGHTVKHFTAVRIEANAGQETTALVCGYVYDGMDIALPAEVTVQFVALPGFEIDVETTEHGFRYRVRDAGARGAGR